MKAMILAAGEGRRMLPLTATTPKPLLKVAGKSLIEHQIDRLRAAGFCDLIINTAYLGGQIEQALGNGVALGVRIQYSAEATPLETGGALHRARRLLGEEPFVLINGDIWIDYPLRNLSRVALPERGAHLILVDNPEHHPAGDFELTGEGVVQEKTAGPAYTFSGLSLISPQLLDDYPDKRDKFPLIEILRWAIAKSRLCGEHYPGHWLDIGTPARLQALEHQLQARR